LEVDFLKNIGEIIFWKNIMLKFEKEKFKLKDKIGAGIILIALGLFFMQRIWWGGDTIDKKEIIINNEKLTVDVANDDRERYQGLSNREKLGKNQGMLFVHDWLSKHQYVMRGMKFDLDFIFIKDDKVVDIAKNVSKDFKGKIQGATEYDKILEVPAGWVDRNGIGLGDVVGIDN
jgi:uncharacterized membrane protein (UPF0127 family)